MGEPTHVQSAAGHVQPGYGPQSGTQDRPGPAPMPQMKLSPEEIRVLKECGRESFWFRSVPFSMIFMGSTQILINRGILQQTGRFGKLTVAAILGYGIGKISYQSACKSKILKLENSHLADMIRKGNMRAPYQLFPETSTSEAEVTQSPSLSTTHDLDTGFDANKYKGLDESQRPNLDSVPLGSTPWQAEEDDKPKNNISYDDLRRQNRQVYQERQAAYSPRPSSRSHPASVPPPPTERAPAPAPAMSKGTKKNEYGDVWDD